MWFDCAMIEDRATKAEAIKDWESLHLFGMCLWTS